MGTMVIPWHRHKSAMAMPSEASKTASTLVVYPITPAEQRAASAAVEAVLSRLDSAVDQLQAVYGDAVATPEEPTP